MRKMKRLQELFMYNKRIKLTCRFFHLSELITGIKWGRLNGLYINWAQDWSFLGNSPMSVSFES